MASINNKPEPPLADPVSTDAKHTRPKKLLQRLSSGLSTMLPSISTRRGSSSTHTSDRPETAPSHTHKHRRRKARSRRHLPIDEQLIIPQLNIPQLSDADTNCPYDPSTYHSFPSIEDESCSFCGLRPFSRTASAFSTSHRPCGHCRSRTPSSHLASPLTRSSRRISTSRAPSSNLPTLSETSPSTEDIPRTVPHDIAAGRINNPPRTSHLPPGLAPSYRTSHLSPDHSHDPLHTRSDSSSRPISPRLHHLHLLPHSHSHPYVHKREVTQHMAALEAGSPSPLPQVLDEGPAIPISNGPYRDFSRTVYYGTTPSSAASTASSLVIRRVEIVDEHEGALGGRGRLRVRVNEMEFRTEERVGREGGGRSRRRERAAGRGGRDGDGTGPAGEQTVSALDTNEVLKIEDGVEEMQLRGGGGEAVSARSSVTSPLGSGRGHVLRGAHTYPYRQPLRRDHTQRAAPKPIYQSSQPPTPFLGLRGGGSSPSPSPSPPPSPIRIPRTLYFLAGGTGRRPITLNAWKKQRGARRFGGLLGMAVFGSSAGREYRDDEKGGREEGDCRSGDDGGKFESRSTGGSSGRANGIGSASPVGSRSSSKGPGMDSSSSAMGCSSGSCNSCCSEMTRSGRHAGRQASTRATSMRSTHSSRAESAVASESSVAPVSDEATREEPDEGTLEARLVNGHEGLVGSRSRSA